MRKARDWAEAYRLTNRLSPEHLQLMLPDPRAALAHVRQLRVERSGELLDLPPATHRNLELVQTLGEMAEPYGAWVRLHYVYPYPSVDEVIPLMATGKVLPYLDVPFQHSHPDVLRRMKRPASGEKNLERIQQWRQLCPQLVIRSTFIAGFPGETEAEFEHLLNFLHEARIDRAGCFAYSPVDGAQANALPGQLPDALSQITVTPAVPTAVPGADRKSVV